MKYLRHSGVAGGGIESVGMSQGMQTMRYESNQQTQRPMAATPEMIGASLRSAVEDFAAAIFDAVPAASRSVGETQFLSDVRRGRRELNEATLLRLFVIASRANVPITALSDAFLGLEIRVAHSVPVCAFEAIQSETIAQSPADQAAFLAAHEDTPVRWYQLAETLGTHIAQATVSRMAALRRAMHLEAKVAR